MKSTGLAILCLLVAGLSVWASVTAVGTDDDFVGIYAAAKLAGTGHLFDTSLITRIEAAYQPKPHALPFLRIPIYALIWKPLAWFSFPVARFLWALLNLIAMIAAAWLWPGPGAWAKAFILCSYPFVYNLALGQDTAFFLLLAVLACRLLEKHRDAAAGFLISLCAIKFHLALLLPVVLIAKRRWNAVATAAAGVLALLALSAAEGIDWPMREMRSIQGEHTGPAEMPNFYGFSVWFPHHLGIEIVLGCAATVLVWWIATRSQSPWTAVAAALAGGLLISHHAYFYDAVVLLPLMALALSAPGRGKLLAALLISPQIYLMRPAAFAYHFVWLEMQFLILTVIVGLLLWLHSQQPADKKAPGPLAWNHSAESL